MSYTPFRKKITREIYYSTQKFNTEAIDIMTGKTFEFEIPRHGDFIHRIYLNVLFDSKDSVKFNQGHALIDVVDFLCGDKIIQRETGKTLYLRMLCEENRPGAFDVYNNGLNYMLGGLNFDDQFYYPRPYLLQIPLTFYFFGNDELAFPLCSITKEEVRVRVRFNRKAKYFVFPTIENIPTTVFTDIENVLRSENENVLMGSVKEAEIIRILEDLELEKYVEFSERITDVINNNRSENTFSAYLNIEYGYMSEELRLKFMKRPRDYVIDEFQVYEHRVQGGQTYRVSDTNFINPVKAVFFHYQDTEKEVSDPFNYAREDFPAKLQRDILESVKIEVGENTIIDHYSGTKEFLRTSMFHSSFPGGPRLELNSIIYTVPFCDRPMEKKPTSYINFSASSRNTFEIILNFPYNYQILQNGFVGHIIALSINVVRIRDGRAIKLWSNPYSWN